MTFWELFRLGFAILLGIFSFRINQRLFTGVFDQAQQNFVQNTGISSSTDSTDTERSGTMLAVSASTMLAYFVWKYTYAFVLCGILVVAVLVGYNYLNSN